MAKILIADDAAFIRSTLQDALSQNGFREILTAENGSKALEQYEKERPDLVLLDIMMPEMDGLEVLKKIRAKDPDTRVVILSDMGHQAMGIEAFASGATDVILKPLTQDRLLAAVRKALG